MKSQEVQEILRNLQCEHPKLQYVAFNFSDGARHIVDIESINARDFFGQVTYRERRTEPGSHMKVSCENIVGISAFS